MIEKIIANYFSIRYTERLNEYQISCPYIINHKHNDRNKSASLNFRKKVFYCFTCGLGKTFQQIYDELIKQNNMTDKITTDLNELIKQPTNITNVDFSQTFANLLAQQTQDTRIKKEISKEECIQYAIQSMKDKGISINLLDKIGALPIIDSKENYYGYIKFPTDNNGSFVARKYLPDEILQGERYLLSAGSRPIVGDISNNNFEDYILVEGYLDYISLKYILGYENTLCNLSTNLNKERAYKLKGKVIFILFDNDYKGFEDTEKAYTTFRQIGAFPIKLDLPEKFGKDPNDAVHYHKEEFLQWLEYYIKQSSATDNEYINKFGNEQQLYTLKSGINCIDNEVFQGGYSVGLHAIAAKPTVGKTALGLFIAHNLVLYNKDIKVLYLTYEVPKKQCWARLSSIYDIEHSWPEIEKNSFMTEEAKRMSVKLSERIRIVYGWDISEIYRAANNYNAIFIDYIQIMPGDHLDEKTNVSRNIKALSRLMMDKEKIIFVISSIPRSGYDKTDLSVFKESGDIEYAIQSGMLLTPTSQASEIRLMNITILKNTRGPVGGNFWLEYNTIHNTFKEITPEL